MKIMKAIYGIITAATAASLALVSCNKEFDSPERAETGGIGAERVITLTFDEATKSQISGYHPSFKAGDQIRLSNGTAAPQTVTVTVDDNGSATVTTTLTGTLTAVYPASAAVESGNSITGFSVPQTQHGTFAEANIAMAENIEANGMARFTLKTAVLRFYVDETIDVKEITVTSTGADIATEGTKKTISVTPDDTAVTGATTLYDMTADHPDRRICYVAVLPGVTASDLTFTSDTESQGIVTRQSPGTGTLAVKGMYDAFIPYYIKIKVSSSPDVYQKWAYCNVGAFLPEEAGKYFAWGDTEGQYAATAGANAFTTKPFNWANAPFNNGSSTFNQAYFNSHKSTFCPGDVLALQYDAAYKNWGANWRMPTGMKSDGADIVILAKACGKEPNASFVISLQPTNSIPTDQGVYRYNGTGVKGIYFVDASGNKLFFPASGRGSGTSIDTTECPPVTYGFYWSCTLNSTEGDADRMDFNAGNLSLSLGNQFNYGYCVRPIYKNPVNPLDIGGYDAPTDIE